MVDSYRIRDGRLRGHQRRRMLSLLAQRYGGWWLRQELATALWPTLPSQWPKLLRVWARQLNDLFGKEVIVRSRVDGYRVEMALLPPNLFVPTLKPPRLDPVSGKLRGEPWTKTELQFLRAQAGSLPVEQLAARLTELSGRARSVYSVKGKARELGLSLDTHHITLMDVGRVFGLPPYAVRTRWVYTHALPTERRPGGRDRVGHHMVSLEALKRFMRDYPWEFEWQLMQQGHQLTALAQRLQAEPWYTQEEVAKATGLLRWQVSRMLRAGTLPHARQMLSAPGRVRAPRWRIPHCDVRALQEGRMCR